MPSSPKRFTLAGSERQPVPSARSLGAARPDERFEVTVRVRAKTPPRGAAAAARDDQHPARRKVLSRAEHEAAHGADPADLKQLAEFARAHGLAVVESSAARRSVVLSGTVQAMSAAFGVTLEQFEHEAGTYRGRTGAITLPAELEGVVEGVFGLDNRPQAEPHFVRHEATRRLSPMASTSFTPTALARLYDFPTGLDGSGECIGIIELGGGYRRADLNTYFASLGLAPPKVKTVLVDHGHNHPTNASSADGEVMLDIEVAGAVAPKATIAVYFAPNTDQGFLDAITTAVHDSVNKPSVISISWGSAESNWSAQAMTQFDQAFEAAAAMGVTVCVAAGDNGSGDGVGDGKLHVDFSASSPNVTNVAPTATVSGAATAAEGSVYTFTVGAVSDLGADTRSSYTITWGDGLSDTFTAAEWTAAAGSFTHTGSAARGVRA